MHLEGLSKEAG